MFVNNCILSLLEPYNTWLTGLNPNWFMGVCG